MDRALRSTIDVTEASVMISQSVAGTIRELAAGGVGVRAIARRVGAGRSPAHVAALDDAERAPQVMLVTHLIEQLELLMRDGYGERSERTKVAGAQKPARQHAKRPVPRKTNAVD